MATNEILKFASTNTGTNLLTQDEYSTDAQRTTGHQSGVARSKLANKAMRQVSAVASGVAQFIADNQANNVTDSLTAQNIADYLSDAILDCVLASGIGALNGLSDVEFSGLEANQRLKYNGTKWTNIDDGIFPDYSSPTSITINNLPIQATANGWVTIAAIGAFRNDLKVYVGSDSSCPYLICAMGDDINVNSKASSFSFAIKSGSYYRLQPGPEGFESITAYFWAAA